MSLPSVVYSNGPLTVDTARISETPESSRFINHKMTGKYKVNDVLTLLAAVQDGLGYAMISSSNLYCPVADINLKPLLTHYGLCNRGLALYALYPHRKQTALVREFISAVKAHIGTPPLWEKHVPNFSQLIYIFSEAYSAAKPASRASAKPNLSPAQ